MCYGLSIWQGMRTRASAAAAAVAPTTVATAGVVVLLMSAAAAVVTALLALYTLICLPLWCTRADGAGGGAVLTCT
jgi:hypothetical protein